MRWLVLCTAFLLPSIAWSQVRNIPQRVQCTPDANISGVCASGQSAYACTAQAWYGCTAGSWHATPAGPSTQAVGGVLTGNLPNPGLAAGAVGTASIANASVTDAKITALAYSKLTGAPSALPPNGSAGGDLSGTYPNPSLATTIANAHTFSGQLTTTNINCPITSATIVDATSTIPSTTCFTLLTSTPGGTTSLSSNPQIVAGTVDGQQLTVYNATGNTVILANSNGVVSPTGTTITLGKSAQFVWYGPLTKWVGLASTSTDAAQVVSGTFALGGARFANQGTTTTILHGNGAGNPSFSQVDLTADVTGVLPTANGGVGAGSLIASWTSMAVAALADGTNFGGPFKSGTFVGKARNISCSWATVGTLGTTGVVIKVRDTTAGSDLASCTLGACTTTINTPLTCDLNSAAMVAGHVYTVQYDATTDCTVNPSNTACVAELVAP